MLWYLAEVTPDMHWLPFSIHLKCMWVSCIALHPFFKNAGVVNVHGCHVSPSTSNAGWGVCVCVAAVFACAAVCGTHYLLQLGRMPMYDVPFCCNLPPTGRMLALAIEMLHATLSVRDGLSTATPGHTSPASAAVLPLPSTLLGFHQQSSVA